MLQREREENDCTEEKDEEEVALNRNVARRGKREGEKRSINPRTREGTYRDVNQPVIKISEGFALNGPVTFIRPRFFDELFPRTRATVSYS